jgi:serpin B
MRKSRLLLLLAGFIVLVSTLSYAEDLGSAAKANNLFAFDLYSRYKSEDGNIFFSPYSISTALAMTYEGARGKTADEIQAVLHFPKDIIALRQSSLEIYQQINKKDKKYKLGTANALWAQKDYKFLDEYFKLIGQYYRGKATNLDFINETEKSCLIINHWVEQQTEEKIKDLVSLNDIDIETRLVLTNAIYFKGFWFRQFNKQDTKKADFRISPEHQVKVQMMHFSGKESEFNYAETDNLQILELPYEGKDLSMLILLSKADGLKAVENSLTSDNLAKWQKMFSREKINIYLPRFKFETKYFMADDLKAMGMPTAFSRYADFSGMTGKEDLFISEVIHQAFVDVNEEGTEAAAATAVIMARKSAMPKPVKEFRADHPFIFLIQDQDTGNILFIGRVSDPTK